MPADTQVKDERLAAWRYRYGLEHVAVLEVPLPFPLDALLSRGNDFAFSFAPPATDCQRGTGITLLASPFGMWLDVS
jgi:hypothetical protein